MNHLGKDRAKKLAKLATSKGRREQGHLLIDSAPLVRRALDLGLVEELFVDDRRSEELLILAQRAEDEEVEVTYTDKDLLTKICGVQTPAGLAATILRPAEPDLSELRASSEVNIVFLERISDPGNLGTMARTAAAFGCDLLAVSEGSADPESQKAMRASAGALLSLPFARMSLEDLKPWVESGATLLRTVVAGGESLSEVGPLPKRILWLGNEADGVSDLPAGYPCRDVTISMSQGTESLNVASAAAIFLQRLAESDS